MSILPDHLRASLLETDSGFEAPSAVEDAMVSLCITSGAGDTLNVLSGLLLTQDGWVLTAAHGLDFEVGSGWVAVASDLTHQSISLDSRFPGKYPFLKTACTQVLNVAQRSLPVAS